MRSERANLASRDSAAVLHFANDFLHPVDCGSREGVTIELHIQLAASRVADCDGFSVLGSAPKKEFPQPVRQLLFLGNSRSQKKRARSVAKEPAKLAGRAPRPEHFLSPPGCEERLCHSQGLKQSQATTAHIERVTVFPQAQFGVKNGRKGRIGVVRFAGRDDPVNVFRLLAGVLQRPRADLSSERAFIFVFRYVRERDNAGPCFQLSRGHSESLVHFFRRNETRPKRTGGSDDEDTRRSQSPTPFLTGPRNPRPYSL